MVNATVDNDPISITLADGESTTVPSGEVWKVTLVARNFAALYINGVEINDSKANSGEPNSNSFETVLMGGDKLEVMESEGVHIGGFVVSSSS